jgi:hypothetical protein
MFLEKLNDALPPYAWDQLREIPVEGVEEWATRWHIPFPCVIREARAIADYSKRGNDLSLDFGGFSFPRPPAEWLTVLRGLNTRTVDATYLDDVLASVASTRELEQQELKIAADVRESRRARKRGDQLPGGIWREDLPWLQESRRQFNEREIPQRRSELLDLPRAGAAVGADPLRESEDHFMFRARNHWKARLQEAKRMGYQPVRAWPDMVQHVEWTIRHIVSSERLVDIAKSCRPSRSRQLVSRAVHDVVALLDTADSD